MVRTPAPLPDWEKLLAAERHVQRLVPGAVLVGGTAAALHAGHRRSQDGDHVLADLRGRFDEVLAALGRFDAIYAQLGGASPLAEVGEALGAAAPVDLADVDLASFRGLVAPWTEWRHVAARGQHQAGQVARLLLEGADG